MKSVALEQRLESGLVQSIFRPCARELVQFFGNRRSPTAPRRLLDIGCGSGIAARMAAARYQLDAAHGFDASPNAIDVARAVAPSPPFHWWVDDATTFAVHQPYDAIVC